MDKKFNLSKNIKFAIISFVINIALVFISYKLVISYAGIDALGLWSLLMAWGTLVRLGDVGMGNATLHFVAKSDIETKSDEIHKFIDTGFLMNSIAFFILTTVGFLITNYFLTSIVQEDSLSLARELLPMIFIGIFLFSVSSVIFGSLQGLHFGYISSYLNVGGNLIQILFVIIFIPKYGIVGLVYAQIIQYFVLVFCGWYIMKRKSNSSHLLPINFSIETLKTMFGFSLKAQIANILNSLVEPFSKILFSQFGNLQMQGLYELAYKTVSLARNTVITGVTASLPSITNTLNNDKEKAKDFYQACQRNVKKSILSVMFLVILFSPVVSLLWIGKWKIDYSVFVTMLALGFLFNALGATSYNLGLASGKMFNNIISTFVVLMILLIAGFILGFYFKSVGVVLALSISLSIGGIVIKYLNEKLLLD